MLAYTGYWTVNKVSRPKTSVLFKQNHLYFFFSGITNSIDTNTLVAMTGEQRYVVRSENFNTLTSIISDLLNVACRGTPAPPVFTPAPPVFTPAPPVSK